MAATLEGRIDWSLVRDQEGHRDYTLVTKVTAAITDGPYIVMTCPGLPLVGSIWSFGGDLDPWAFCWPEMRVTPERKEEPNILWRVEQKFSTRPLKRCQDTSIENPLLEPQKVSGSFVRYVKTATEDRNGNPIKTSSHEPITGPDVEFNDSRPTVHIEQNRAALELSTITQMRDTVNDAPLWGLPARTVLLTGISWERLLYGTCTYYYKRIFDFEIDFGTHDRTTPDYGTMTRRGHWDRDPASSSYKQWIPDITLDSSDQSNFDRFTDWHGEVRRVYLDGEGDPIATIGTGTGTGTGALAIKDIDIEYYDQSNFLTLGIPVILDP